MREPGLLSEAVLNFGGLHLPWGPVIDGDLRGGEERERCGRPNLSLLYVVCCCMLRHRKAAAFGTDLVTSRTSISQWRFVTSIKSPDSADPGTDSEGRADFRTYSGNRHVKSPPGGRNDAASLPPPPPLTLLPHLLLNPRLNGVCLPDLPRMKCHISDWSLSLNRFLCLPWFPRPSLTSLLGCSSLMCQPRLGDAGEGGWEVVGGIFAACVRVRAFDFLKWWSGSALR